jgi:hypothetical protein
MNATFKDATAEDTLSGSSKLQSQAEMVYTPELLLTCAAESRRGTILSYWQARLEVAKEGSWFGS